MADLSNVINVAVQPPGRSVAEDNINAVAIMTSQTGTLSSAERFRVYVNTSEIASDFGTNSATFQLASTLLAQGINPTDVGGVLIIGFWRAVDEVVAATAGRVDGAQLNEAVVLPQLQAISDGSFDITVDANPEQTVSALDFRTATDLAGVASILDTAVTDATVTVVDNRLTITSNTTGAASAVTLASDAATGTFVGPILGLSAGSGANAVAGVGSVTLTAESKVDALTALSDEIIFKGHMFVDDPTDSEVTEIATWSQANDVLSYDVFDDVTNLEVDTTNIVWSTKLLGQTNYRMLYDPSGNRNFAAAYMGRSHVVNFDGDNTALTMNLKDLVNVTSTDLSQSDISKAARVGLDIYVPFKDVPKVLASGANDFADNRYNLLAFTNAVQTALFNLLGTTATKVPQTRPGVNTLVNTVERQCQRFVTAGFIAPGTWTSSDRFGDVDVFNQNILLRGFYVLARPLSTQTIPDREARISPLIQVAIKNAGAFHKANVLINFNL